MQKNADDCRTKDGADVRSTLRHWGDEVWFWSKKDHLVETAEEEAEERAANRLLVSAHRRLGGYIELTPCNTEYIARCI